MWDTQSFHRPTDRSQIQLCIFIYQYLFYLPNGKESSCQCRRCRRSGVNPWVGKILWRRNQQPTPVILHGKSHEQRILESYSPWGRKELDTTKHAHTLILQHGLVKPLKTCSFKKKTHTNFVNYKLYIDSKAYDIILAHSSLSWPCTKDGMTCQYYCHKYHNQSIGQFSHSVMSDSLWSHGQQHVRRPCPSPTSRACSNSCPLTQWCHPTISSSIVPFSSCLQSFPASGFFQMSQFFSSGSQSIGASASVSVLPVNFQDWFPLGLTGWISLQFKGLSRAFSNTTVQKH